MSTPFSDKLPQDPYILVSFVNTKIRDNKWDLDEFCREMQVSKSDVEAKLLTIGYRYCKKSLQFADRA